MSDGFLYLLCCISSLQSLYIQQHNTQPTSIVFNYPLCLSRCYPLLDPMNQFLVSIIRCLIEGKRKMIYDLWWKACVAHISSLITDNWDCLRKLTRRRSLLNSILMMIWWWCVRRSSWICSTFCNSTLTYSFINCSRWSVTTLMSSRCFEPRAGNERI